ncbi:hypothetical protein ACFSSA_09015 [Luteolibacter algae]|uniref:PEP-CTERM sorting domain-containing protein n=1 Tax=Luteolibacter algae TaxID=454151 RepID=A0ABW5DA39_9BACT
MKKTTTSLKLSLLAATSCLAFNHLASAAIVYTNDFNSGTAGDAPGQPFGEAGSSGFFDLAAADGNFDTQYLKIASRSDNGNYYFPYFDSNLTTSLTSAVATFSFDARFNTADFGTYGSLRLRTRSGSTTLTETAWQDLGASGFAVTLDTVNHYDFAINNTNAAVTIDGLGGTLAANSYGIYQNGVLMDSQKSNRSSAIPGEAITYMSL